MKSILAIGAAALLAPLVAVAGPANANAGTGTGTGTGTSPPAIGSCYEMTSQEVRSASNANPPVDCSTRHTTTTFEIVEFAEPPDWNDEDAFAGEVYDQCNPSWVEVLGGNPKTITRSSYTYYWLMPTPAQREAGAAWVRCELALRAGGSIAALPENVSLGQLPLPDGIAKCREGQRSDYRITVCSRAHRYRATTSIRIPGRWRGADAAQAFALHECRKRVRSGFHYEWQNSRYWWRLGFRYATCLPRDH